MQQRGVLGDHADLSAQAFLGDLSDVLAIDQDAPALQVVQAQQQVDQGRLACTGRADQADFFPGLDVQVQATNDPALLAVVEIHLFETHFAMGHVQAWGVLAVGHRQRRRDGFKTVLHHADVFENTVDHPHDPARHVDDPNHQAGGQGNRADGDQ